MPQVKMKEIRCDLQSCKKLIGRVLLSGRKRFYDGVHQWGAYTACSFEHLVELKKQQFSS